jgi:hypothetical protein
MQVSHGREGLFHIAIKLHNGFRDRVITTETHQYDLSPWVQLHFGNHCVF